MVRVFLVLAMGTVSVILAATALWQTKYMVGGACLSVGTGTLFGGLRELRRERTKNNAKDDA